VAAPRLVALAVFAALTVVHTWPLATNPAHLSRIDVGDGALNAWAVAWVAHQLPRDPVHLFDANIFYPERLTLAYSEAMIVQGVLAIPVLAAGGSPVLAFNMVLLSGLVFTGCAFCLLIRRWTGSWAAGYVGGSAAAFNSHVLVRLPHLQTQHVEFIALVLFCVDRLVTSRRLRDAAWLGLAFALEGLTSVYVLVFTAWMLIFAVAARAGEWLRKRPLNMLGLLATAAVVAAALMAPYLFAYYQLHRLTGFERTVDDARLYAGSINDYLTTGSRIHYPLWSHRFFEQSASPTFPGIVASALAICAIAWEDTWRDARVRMCLVAGIGCAVVSALPNTPLYPALYAVIPLFRAVRVLAHIEQIVLLMIAILAGFGVAALGRRWRDARTWPALAAVLALAVNVEALRAPINYRPFTGVPRIYDVLAGQPGAVVELPFYPPDESFSSAPYMINSTRHWRPILNGYSGFRPASYAETYDAISGFPDEASLAALRARGVTNVVVHAELFSGMRGRDRFMAIERTASLEPVAASGDIHVYRLKGAAP
jgi:hypothetical protein